jgi:hypothetical protein
MTCDLLINFLLLLRITKDHQTIIILHCLSNNINYENIRSHYYHYMVTLYVHPTMVKNNM